MDSPAGSKGISSSKTRYEMGVTINTPYHENPCFSASGYLHISNAIHTVALKSCCINPEKKYKNNS